MGIFRRTLRRVADWFRDEPKSPPPRDGGGFGDFTQTDDFSLTPTPSPFTTPPQDLPQGWKFEGLYHTGDPGVKQINQDPTNSEVANADSIIVSYTDGLGPPVYRTIHGAASRKDVGSLITRVIKVVSPR